MSTDVSLFHFDEDRQSFEDLGRPNGPTHWVDSDLMRALGYQTNQGFDNAILRAKKACLSIGINIEDHFARQPDGTTLLTRFGCYLVAINGDPKKSQVAQAQVYFAALADTVHSHIENADGIDRILIRDEITDGHKSLNSTAKAHGVQNHAFFMNAGYMGMYNMGLTKLEQLKGVKKGELIDHMGREEMAAHLFRITQTDAKINKENIRGQKPLENAARSVGKTVRETMKKVSGTSPESLPPEENIQSVKKKLKGTGKTLSGADVKKLPRKKST